MDDKKIAVIKDAVKTGAIPKIPMTKVIRKKPESLETSSEISTDHGMELGGSMSARLNGVIDKLQDPDW